MAILAQPPARTPLGRPAHRPWLREYGVGLVLVAVANRVGTELGWRSWALRVGSPTGAFLARMRDDGMVTARVVLDSPDLVKWRGIATYPADRQPDAYGPYLG